RLRRLGRTQESGMSHEAFARGTCEPRSIPWRLTVRMHFTTVVIALALAVSIGLTPLAQPAGEATARARVQRAAAALGGEATLRAITRVWLSGISVLYQREQSERPEGPWLPTFMEFADVRDVTASIVQRTSRTRGYVTEDEAAWSAESSTLVADGLALR